LDRSLLLNLAGAALSAGGDATVANSVIANGASSGIVIQPGGSLSLLNGTVVGQTAYGVDNQLAGLVSVSSSVVYGNGTADLIGVACADVEWSDVCSPDCTAQNDNICGPPELDAGFLPGATSPLLDHGPDPSLYPGVPCRDAAGGPRLRDHDGDGLAESDIGAYELENTALSPADVANLRWTDARTLVWDAEPAATEYHVYRDDLANLGYDDFGACRDDLDGVVTDTTLDDNESPLSGQCFYYLITAEETGGEEGTLGLGTCAERSNFAACSP
jgi:hypothetical protein